MRSVTFKNKNNEQITLSTVSKPFILVDFDDTVANNIHSNKAFRQDGESYRSSNLDVRDIDLEIFLNGDNREDLINKKSLINRVFNPKLEQGLLIYNDKNINRNIDCIVTAIPYFKDVNSNNSRCLINLEASNPYYKGYEISEEIITWIGGMTFPLRLPTRFAMAGEKIVNIINSGDVETPIKLEIYGPATNPKVLLRETGEFIKINRKLLSGDVLVTTTDFGNKRVELNGVNVFNYIDYSSTFFSLGVGDNVIELTTEDVSDNANIKITYRNRFVGV